MTAKSAMCWPGWLWLKLTVVELLEALPEGFEVDEAVVLYVQLLPQGASPVLPVGG